MRLRRKHGKLLGGEPPRRGGRLSRRGRSGKPQPKVPASLLGMLAFGLFVLGLAGGFAWAMDRQIRGGLLAQEAEARARGDWVRLEELPEYVPYAFGAVVEPRAVPRGTLRTGETRTSISEELVRQVHMLPAGFAGDARALFMSPVLEQRASRERLLEMFLNRVYLGELNGYPIYGVAYAARDYFDKEPTELTLGETATLAGLLLPPRIYQPQRAVGAVGARRKEVLEVLLRGELITEEQFRQALAEPLGFQPGLAQMPMTRPPDWGREDEVIRLPEELRTPPDSLAEEESGPE